MLAVSLAHPLLCGFLCHMSLLLPPSSLETQGPETSEPAALAPRGGTLFSLSLSLSFSSATGPFSRPFPLVQNAPAHTHTRQLAGNQFARVLRSSYAKGSPQVRRFSSRPCGVSEASNGFAGHQFRLAGWLAGSLIYARAAVKIGRARLRCLL